MFSIAEGGLDGILSACSAPNVCIAIDNCVGIGMDGCSVIWRQTFVVLYAKSRRQQLMLLDVRA